MPNWKTILNKNLKKAKKGHFSGKISGRFPFDIHGIYLNIGFPIPIHIHGASLPGVPHLFLPGTPSFLNTPTNLHSGFQWDYSRNFARQHFVTFFGTLPNGEMLKDVYTLEDGAFE